MRLNSAVLLLCIGLLLVLPTSVEAADQVIRPEGNQDAAIYSPGGAPELAAPGLWVGAWSNGAGFWSVGIHWLTDDGTSTGTPLTVPDVPQALLLIPECDSGGSGEANYNTLNLDTYHIDAVSDSTVSAGDDTSADLGLIGHYRVPGPTNTDGSRYVQFDVTDMVHADINASRATFASRVQQNPVASVSGYRSWPAVENTDGFFGTLDGDPYTDNHGARLVIKEPGTVEGICDDGLDDDGDTLIDCDDPDCSERAVCPENCTNGVDDDADGDVDCDDSECASDPACPETLCADGLDNDGDTLTDCADPDCTDDDACPEICDDTIDNDADGDVDCDDSECVDYPLEPCRESLCADGLDGDSDGLTDCDDPDCAPTFACGAGEEVIVPEGPQDGYTAPWGVDNSGVRILWGTNSIGEYITPIHIHSLPAGVTSGMLQSATLEIAGSDVPWSGSSWEDLRELCKHIDANDDAAVTIEDWTSVALGDCGVYREPVPYTPYYYDRIAVLDVTDQVKADLDAGRATFAVRLEPDPVTVTVDTKDTAYYPTVEHDPGFPFQSSRLTLRPPGIVEDYCDNGIDDDGNGLTDCGDPWCSDDPVCPENCVNGDDDDADGLVDCDDPECLSSPACPEGICDDGVDNDEDGAIDCSDSDCFGAVGCQSEAGYCGDGQDNDNDCMTDAADQDCAGYTAIYPTSTQDGTVFSDGSVAYTGSWAGAWGSADTANQIQMVQAGIHTLPAVAPGDVDYAELRVPEHSIIWNTGGYAMLDNDVDILHIDATDDTEVKAEDGNSTELANLGRYRDAGDPGPNPNTKFRPLDVTAAVQADLTASRLSFAWRLNVLGELPLGTGGENNPSLYFPTVDANDPAFPPWNTGARLILYVAGQYENNCTDTVDNDGDTAVDCDDFDCYNDPACNVAGEASCADGVDNDIDGNTDCFDSDCVGDPCCGPFPEICTNGVDDNANGLIDCDDVEWCNCAPHCGPPPDEVCDNAFDDDCDDDVDCDDADCYIDPVCGNCNDPFADADGDTDVDHDDFAQLQLCITGDAGGVLVDCGCFNADGDDDVDADDVALFELCASGPDVPADASCD